MNGCVTERTSALVFSAKTFSPLQPLHDLSTTTSSTHHDISRDEKDNFLITFAFLCCQYSAISLFDCIDLATLEHQRLSWPNSPK
jgi:hypothetical protein